MILNSKLNTRGVTLVSKVGVPIQKENKASSGPEAKGEENGEEVSPPHLTLGSRRVVSSPSRVREQSPSRK